MVDLNFSPIQLDALKEIGNVGAGNAATALGQLMKREPGSSELLTLVELSAISETAYILCCSYLDSVGEMLNHRLLIPSSPQTAIDKMNNLNKVLIKRFIGEDVKYIMSIENKMYIKNIKIDLFVTFLLEYESTKKIFEMLGL